ncbi:CaiB/baiF CoA-transferase family protein [Cyphellophora attinorum]|uniref:CaiB/baiF CoA-transferase family protein n=1 Tax=Cyphellophora attinorum TaxID=1664694 RepID=A0A0N1HKX2_9EURO|nr:CaiB/baiF CoA-transferase family protein [Phialophora attinorum]KPI37500.1 CaiB/baiF CoA-transferase family protein [Phialophora attinorum]
MSGRASHSTYDTIAEIWTAVGLPSFALGALRLPNADNVGLPSSYKVGQLAQATIALTALAATLIHTSRQGDRPAALHKLPTVTVPLDHACIEFRSERFYTINGHAPAKEQHAIGGLHSTKDGHVRIHDGFPHHRAAALHLIGCLPNASTETIKRQLLQYSSTYLETRAFRSGAIIAALRSCEEWDSSPQASAVADFPVLITKIAEGPAPGWKAHLDSGGRKCLAGLRVLEFSRVLAAPVCGRTLAVHGADVLWVTSPKLPSLPALDKDTARGKRSIQLDLTDKSDTQTFDTLCQDVDVVIQGYRPGALAAKGVSKEELLKKTKGGLVYASLSAYGSSGPWSKHRGFDSIVQTQSGINVSEADHYGQGEASRVLPCQALDHASGYFLAFAIMTALYKQATEGGSYAVEVSLAGTMKYLKSLGQYPGNTGFDCTDASRQADLPVGMLETKISQFGSLKAVKHAATIDGLEVGWDRMPRPLGSDEPRWL